MQGTSGLGLPGKGQWQSQKCNSLRDIHGPGRVWGPGGAEGGSKPGPRCPGVVQSGQAPFGPSHESCVPRLLPQAQGSGVPGSGLMRVPEHPRLCTQHWNPSAPSYLPGQTLSLTAAVLTRQSIPSPPHLCFLCFCCLPLQAHPPCLCDPCCAWAHHPLACVHPGGGSGPADALCRPQWCSLLGARGGPLVFRLQGCRRWGHTEHARALPTPLAWLG